MFWQGLHFVCFVPDGGLFLIYLALRLCVFVMSKLLGDLNLNKVVQTNLDVYRLFSHFKKLISTNLLKKK